MTKIQGLLLSTFLAITTTACGSKDDITSSTEPANQDKLEWRSVTKTQLLADTSPSIIIDLADCADGDIEKGKDCIQIADYTPPLKKEEVLSEIPQPLTKEDIKRLEAPFILDVDDCPGGPTRSFGEGLMLMFEDCSIMHNSAEAYNEYREKNTDANNSAFVPVQP